MKKKIWAILFGIIIAFSFTACSGDGSYRSISVGGEKQDTSYTVYSNGGTAVQYGNYVYFINGNRGYEDASGQENVWGEVVKGALYRAQLIGQKNGNDFTVTGDASTGLDFTSVKGLDYDENIINVVNVQQIAPKTIGTSGYAGGIYIYDDYVYYASPNNQQNKQGVVQASKTDFFRSKLDGSNTIKIFTTESDSASSPYGFYKYGGSVYLVVLDGSVVKSIRINDRKNEVMQIATGVSGMVVPERPVYYPGIENTYGVENFVYFSRAVNDNDTQRAGTVLECMRPDGSERFIFHADGQTASIDAVRDGLVFYRTVKAKLQTAVNYTNMHDRFMQESPSYKANPKYTANLQGEVISRETSTLTGYKSIYAFRPDADQDANNNVVYCLYATANGLYLSIGGVEDRQIYSGAASVKLVAGNEVYFTDSDSGTTLFVTNLYTSAADKEAAADTVATDVKVAGAGLDIVGEYLVYFGKLDEYAADYTFFHKLNGVVGQKAQFVGVRSSADVKPVAAETEESA